jgi:hypothetical protein
MKLVDLLHDLLDKLLHHAHHIQDGNAAALLTQLKEKAVHLNHLTADTDDLSTPATDPLPPAEETTTVNETKPKKQGSKGDVA